MGKSKPAPPPASPTKPFHNPFGGLAERLGITPAPEGGEGAPPGVAPSGPKRAAAPARAVVRLERKGRGGKEVTVLEKLALPAAEAERWALELKRALGCGGGVEGDAVVLSGDQRSRAKEWLEARGVGKITIG